jgi:L-malate glycosyltransferase
MKSCCSSTIATLPGGSQDLSSPEEAVPSAGAVQDVDHHRIFGYVKVSTTAAAPDGHKENAARDAQAADIGHSRHDDKRKPCCQKSADRGYHAHVILEKPATSNACISVCHIVSGDLWAGAEAQVAALLRALSGEQTFQLSAILLNEGRLADEVRECGVELIVIPESHASFAAIVRKATQLLRKRQIQILHSHGYKENLLAALLARRCHIPVVIRTEHGAPEPFTGLKALKQTALHGLDRLVARYATDSIISVSRELQRHLARYVSEKKIVWIPNGLDTSVARSQLDASEAKRRLDIPAGSPVVGYAGRVAPIKRLDIFVAAAKQIRGRFPDARFVVAGEGSERRFLQQAACAAGLGDHFLFLGHRDDIYDVLRAFDVFILSSDHEGLPIVLLEALCLGIPVVARRVGGIPEVIEHGISGLLVESACPQSLADACLELLQNPELRARIAAAGARRVAEHFSADHTAAQTADLYRRLAVVSG